MRIAITELAGLVSAAALLGGCSGPPASSSYFPLEAGHRWAYQQTSLYENDTSDTETLELHSLGEDRAAGDPAWHRRSASGVDYWLRADAGGIYRVASKNDTQDEPERDAAPRFVLKAPLAVGTSWQASTTAYLLRRRQEFPPEIRHSHAPVPMTYTITALGQKVQTAAGAFDDCLKVEGRAAMKLFADPVEGFREMPLLTTEWYCKGTGLVRLERREPANSTFLVGGMLTLELQSWE
jgi:hypothetical protein